MTSKPYTIQASADVVAAGYVHTAWPNPFESRRRRRRHGRRCLHCGRGIQPEGRWFVHVDGATECWPAEVDTCQP